MRLAQSVPALILLCIPFGSSQVKMKVKEKDLIKPTEKVVKSGTNITTEPSKTVRKRRRSTPHPITKLKPTEPIIKVIKKKVILINN